ncbi:methionyl-tRNA formyltransferase [Frankia sp. CNm7]|uniref:Methionyl-tRNA formyltransferase n=1 Tax=Frankia nepalensis TaxID=1836974 RepID=A0A937RJC0_9ACTN|nr:methionyl-tRNA formyltransferase [Frankia nepalensis]MBL7495862.1 methionyl-tRNA formyltransferase [Frankia nepalensis]MBL7510411.1 methionyl-tRNA formyltransferase [Frankia nepalensis]MBL7519175.1 methionyl-tRNA formyltransferase [Frankia nepalensis]MBL7630010.1 methionyl-tRNA formyltransferase [Frankia nepalensis]
MRVVMFGYQTWGHRTLRALLDSRHEVTLVVTHPQSDQPYEKIWSDSVADLAEESGVPVAIRSRPDDDELMDLLKAAAPDVIVATNWRTWIPPKIFGLPPLGTLNIHDSLLPAYAGFSPLIWALINGEREVGVTAHMMDETLDAGDIVLQRAVPVGPRDTTADLFHKTLALFGPITVDGLALIESGRTEWVKQDRSKASFFHKRSLRDSLIDWTWTAEELDRFVRALSDPYPNAFTYRNGERVRVIEADISDGIYGGTPGRIFIREGDGVVIAAGAEARRGRGHGLRIRRVRLDDGTELAAPDYFTTMGGYLTDRP